MVENQTYIFEAVSGPERFSVRRIKQLLGDKGCERYSTNCLVIRRSLDSFVFVFGFGTVVFFNTPESEQLHFLELLGITPPSPRPDSNGALAEDDFTLKVAPGAEVSVSFDSVTIPKLELAKVQLVARLLAQSSALELVEKDVQEFLAESEQINKRLQQRGWLRPNRRTLLKFLSEGLEARHRIVNHLVLLEEPELSWDDEEYHTLYVGLFDNLDLVERVEHVDKMIDLASDVSRLLLEMANAKRSELLELIIIILIAVEIVKFS